MAMESIEELFEHELKELLGGERSMREGLERMADESSDRDIKKTFALHRKETQGQIRRLEKILKSLGQKAEAETCAGIDGLVKEKKVFMREKPSDELIEFYNIGAAQKVERYEITTYENLIDMADKLGLREAVDLLEETLHEEETALNTLKRLASEFDVTDADEDLDELEPNAEEEEPATSRR